MEPAPPPAAFVMSCLRAESGVVTLPRIPLSLHPGYMGGDEAVPLYEGKMVQRYDHRAADVVINAANLHRAAQQEAIQEVVKEQPDRYPMPQYWVSKEEVAKVHEGEWALGFKEITAPTNVRTMIAAVMPGVGFGNKLPVLLPLDPSDSMNAQRAALLLANLKRRRLACVFYPRRRDAQLTEQYQ